MQVIICQQPVRLADKLNFVSANLSVLLTAQTSFDVYTFINAFQFHSLKSLNSINYNNRFVAECIKYQTQDPRFKFNYDRDFCSIINRMICNKFQKISLKKPTKPLFQNCYFNNKQFLKYSSSRIKLPSSNPI